MPRILRRTAICVLAGAVAFGAAPAFAGHKSKSRVKPAKQAKSAKLQFLGVLTATNVDGDPATADTFTFRSLKENGPARRWHAGNPGDVVVTLAPTTRFGGEGGLGGAASDYRVGDGVRVQARTADGALVAKGVRLVLQAYEGTLTAFDAVAGTASLEWAEANKLASDWLATNGNPVEVSFVLAPGAKVERDAGGDPQAGDTAEIKARPTADGTGLEAVKVDATAPEVVEEEPVEEPVLEPVE